MSAAEPSRSAAAIAQRLRAEILSWPDVAELYGPQLGKPGQFFMRFQLADGDTYAIELTKDD